MSDLKKIGDLQIDEDMDFQHKEWAAERWGWLFMVILLLAGLLGLFGQGPLSNTSVQNGSLHVQYGRFERLLAPVIYEVQMDSQNDETRLQLDRDLMSYFTVQHIIPEPDSIELSADQITYVFMTKSSEQPLRISFNLLSQKLGAVRGKIGLENGPAVDINQFIYP